MEKFIKHEGIVAPLDRANVDTDQIIPKQFLKRIERTGFGEFAFFDWRYLEGEIPNPDFILNFPRYLGSEILVAGSNFGSGSSREHAPWALLEYGFKVLISTSFADIFKNNCFQNGILPIILDSSGVSHIMSNSLSDDQEGYKITVDLENQTDWEQHYEKICNCSSRAYCLCLFLCLRRGRSWQGNGRSLSRRFTDQRR